LQRIEEGEGEVDMVAVNKKDKGQHLLKFY
jgi:hypothetical protein